MEIVYPSVNDKQEIVFINVTNPTFFQTKPDLRFYILIQT